MNNRRISLAATLLAGSVLAVSPTLAQDQGFHPVGRPHPAGHPSAPAPAVHRPVPSGTYRVIRPGSVRVTRPGVGFHRGPGLAVRVHPMHAILGRHVAFAHFTPAQRALWVKGRWHHRWWHGRYGWWWYADGIWFWYGAPVYPYPTVVSDYYYEEPDYAETGPTWWYCYNPPGYYPYVPSCYTQWTPVPAQGGGPGYGEEQNGPDQGPPPGDEYGNEAPPGSDQGPPPGDEYGNEAPPGSDQGPPPGYDQGPPPGDEQGPPPGDDQGPPPDDNQYPQNGH